MAKPADNAFTSEGTVNFRSQPALSYRYKVSASGHNVHFWFEERASKKQWRSDEHALADFVNTDNAIPLASMEDYVSAFVKGLEAGTSGEEAPCRAGFTRKADGSWWLQFAIKLTVLTSVQSVQYQFAMHPVQLEAVNVVATQLRDVQEELRKLRGIREEVQQLRLEQQTRTPVVLRLRSTNNTKTNSLIVWTVKTEYPSLDKFVVDPSGKVRFLSDGMYLIVFNVEYCGGRSHLMTRYQLQCDGDVIQNNVVRGGHAACFSCLAPIKKDQELCVQKSSFIVTEAEATMWISLVK